jgi:hypothetical protein
LKTKGDFPRYWHVAVATDDHQMIIHGKYLFISNLIKEDGMRGI